MRCDLKFVNFRQNIAKMAGPSRRQEPSSRPAMEYSLLLQLPLKKKDCQAPSTSGQAGAQDHWLHQNLHLEEEAWDYLLYVQVGQICEVQWSGGQDTNSYQARWYPVFLFTEEEMRRGGEKMEARVLMTWLWGDCQSVCQGRLFALAVAVAIKFVLFPILKLIWA